jgi:plastocyanin
MTRLALAAMMIAACGGDDDGGSATPDAATMIDASQAKVIALASCPATVAATMTSTESAFSPMATTISVNGVVKLMMTNGHNVIPNTLTTTDSVLRVSEGATKCFEFRAVGTYGIACGFHGFAGTITVQ